MSNVVGRVHLAVEAARIDPRGTPCRASGRKIRQ